MKGFCTIGLAVLLLFLGGAGLLTYPLLFPHPRGQPVNYRHTLSSGMEMGDDVYFLTEYTVSRSRRPFWMIMPVERSPRIYYQGIFLYRLQPESLQLEQLALVRDDHPLPAQTSVGTAQLITDDDAVIFAYKSGWDSDLGQLYDLRRWHLDEERLLPGERQEVPVTAALFEQYFAEYVRPFWDNPGYVSVGQLRDWLAEVPDAAWALPRDW